MYGSTVGCISVASTEAFTGVQDGGLVEGHSAGCRSLTTRSLSPSSQRPLQVIVSSIN